MKCISILQYKIYGHNIHEHAFKLLQYIFYFCQESNESRQRRSMIARQQTFIDRLVDLVKIVTRESGNRKKKVSIKIYHEICKHVLVYEFIYLGSGRRVWTEFSYFLDLLRAITSTFLFSMCQQHM